jgi:hypothetical protein
VILATNIQLAPKLIICEINPYLSNAEMNSTALSVAPVPVSRSTRHVILQCFMLVFRKLLPCCCGREDGSIMG